MAHKALEVHERFAGNLAYKDTILWDAYTPEQFPLFKQKINELFREPENAAENTNASSENSEESENSTASPGEPIPESAGENTNVSSENSEEPETSRVNPSEPNPESASENTNASSENSEEPVNSTTDGPGRASKAMEKIRQAVYRSTISQAKYTNKNLLATFILVTVAEGTTYFQAREAAKFSVHLVIRTRKCMKKDDSTDCCMVFIDELGNVYKNWNHFMETNSLPRGVALAPPNGIYKFESDKLLLDSWVTPASSVACQAAAHADIVAGVSGFAAAAATLSAFALPVIVPALPVLGVVCAGTGAYSALRSGWHLWSRKDHEQSIALTDSSSRGAWLGVASGALAVSSSLANQSLAKLALAGQEISLVREVVVNGMNISTMLLSGTGVANGILDLLLKYSDDEEITTLDVVQVAASLAIFTHSAYNFRLASTIVAQTQDSKLSSYRTELSNRQKKMFEKMTKETMRTRGVSKGKMDVIRLINEVPDKQYLNDMNRINRNLNKNNVRFSAGENGQISLNNEIQVNSGDLRSSVQHGLGENYLAKVTQPVPDSHQTIPNQKTVNNLMQNAFSKDNTNLINYCQTALQIVSPHILNGDAFQDCVRNIIINLGNEIAQYLIQKANEFIRIHGRTVEILMTMIPPFEVILWDLYRKCEQSLSTFSIENLEESITSIYEELISYYHDRSFENATVKKVQCDVCKGFYQICSLA